MAILHNIIQEENLSRAEDVSVTKQEDIVAVENMMEELNGKCNVVEDGLAHMDWEAQLGLAPSEHMEANTGTVEMVPVPTDTQVFSVMILEENLEEPGTYLLSIPEVADVEDGGDVVAALWFREAL